MTHPLDKARGLPEPLKLQRCDLCGTIAMPDPVIGCRACGWDEMRPIVPGERLYTAEFVAQYKKERDEVLNAALADLKTERDALLAEVTKDEELRKLEQRDPSASGNQY